MSTPGDLRHLAGGIVVLRPFEERDLAALDVARRDPDIARWNPLPGGGRGALEAWCDRRNDWAGGLRLTWAVADADGGLVGSVWVADIDRDQGDAEVGYWTAPWARRRGVARAALSLASGVAFAELRLARLALFHAVENVGSCRVATTCGYRREGVLRASHRYGDGRHHDEHLHARLAGDRPGD